MLKILIVDDERIIHDLMEGYIGQTHKLFHAENELETMKILSLTQIDLVLLDINIKRKQDGIDILKKIREKKYSNYITMLTNFEDSELIKKSLLLGAMDYLKKPIEKDELEFFIKKIEIRKSLEDENKKLKNKIIESLKKTEIIGESKELIEILNKVKKLTNTSANVFILGESGTGKELIAKKLHEQEEDLTRPFIAINCASLPSNLVESMLFGHEAGAYTDAKESKPGKFELADGGDIFLDEISSMSYDLQGKLLRVLQEKEVERIGSNKIIKVNFRIIAATNKDPSVLIKENKLREDLYYRINTVELKLPSLKERKKDIKLLIDNFLIGSEKIITQEVHNILYNYNWPGNIRELKQVIENVKIFSEGQIVTPIDLPKKILEETPECKGLSDMIKQFEMGVIKTTMKNSKSMREAARVLGVSAANISLKLKSEKISNV